MIKVPRLSNGSTEVAVITAVSVAFLISTQLVYGLAGSLEQLENEVKNETGYRSELIDYINKSFSNDTLYASFTSLPMSDIDEPRQKDMQTLPLFPIEQLEEIAKRLILMTK